MGTIERLLLILEGMLIYRTVYEFLRMRDELRRRRNESQQHGGR